MFSRHNIDNRNFEMLQRRYGIGIPKENIPDIAKTIIRKISMDGVTNTGIGPCQVYKITNTISRRLGKDFWTPNPSSVKFIKRFIDILDIISRGSK